MLRYYSIPRAERKLLIQDLYRARPVYRFYSVAIMFAGVSVSRWIRPLILPDDGSRALSIIVGALLAGLFAVILWYLIVFPLIRRDILRRKNA